MTASLPSDRLASLGRGRVLQYDTRSGDYVVLVLELINTAPGAPAVAASESVALGRTTTASSGAGDASPGSASGAASGASAPPAPAPSSA